MTSLLKINLTHVSFDIYRAEIVENFVAWVVIPHNHVGKYEVPKAILLPPSGMKTRCGVNRTNFSSQTFPE
jgi:hypothetical protein